MTTAASAAIAERQRRLLARSAELRAQLALQAGVISAPLALADQAVDGWRWLRAHPEWPVGIAVVIVVARPRRAWRWGLRAWSAWRLWRALQRQLRAVASG